MEILSQPIFIWFIIGVVFLFLEMSAPGFVAIFFALGCFAASIGAWLFDVSMEWQVGIFIITTLGSLILLRKFAVKIFRGNDGADTADDYEHERIGRNVEVTQAIKPNQLGKIKLDGSFWDAKSDAEMEPGDIGVVVKIDPENPLLIHIKPIEE